MLIFYLYSTLIVGLALGILLLKGTAIKESKIAIFLIGFSLPPFVQFIWTIMIALIFRNGISRYMYILPLPIMATIFVCITMASFLRRKNKNGASLICDIKDNGSELILSWKGKKYIRSFSVLS